MRVWADVGPSTGVIRRIIRGDRVKPRPEWTEITEHPRMREALGLNGQRRMKLCPFTGQVTNKEEVKLVLSKTIIGADGKDVLSVSLEGQDPGHPVYVRVNGKNQELTVGGDPLNITSDVEQRLGVKVEDSRVYVRGRPKMALAVHSEPDPDPEPEPDPSSPDSVPVDRRRE